MCYMQQDVSLLRFSTWRGFLLVLSFDITNIMTHRTHRGHRMTHPYKPYKYILTPATMCSSHLFVLHLKVQSQV